MIFNNLIFNEELGEMESCDSSDDDDDDFSDDTSSCSELTLTKGKIIVEGLFHLLILQLRPRTIGGMLEELEQEQESELGEVTGTYHQVNDLPLMLWITKKPINHKGNIQILEVP